MASVVAQPYGKRFVLALLLVSALAVYFWTQSRYPSLDEKAMMSGAIQLEDSISFEAMLPILPEYPVWKRIAYSTVNWMKTNKQGMTFAIFFAAAFLTLLGYMRQRSFRNGFANSFLGLFIGAPLGVCVNCAAPIAKGLYTGGARIESSLSMMIASPTLNIVVLTIAFSIMPFYMVVLKIGFSVFVILLAIPILCRFLPEGQLQIPEEQRVRLPSLPSPTQPAANEDALWAGVRFAKDYALNLWFIIWTTVPLMLVAGFLGAVVATLLPAELLAQASFGAVGLVAASIVGTFLPMPIGLDVIAAGALLGGGLAHGYIMALLFTLGSFSVYSFFIVASSISLRAAWLLAGVVCALGIVAGVAAHAYQGWQTKRALDILTGFEISMVGSAAAAEAEPFRTIPDGKNVLTVERQPFGTASAPAGAPFTRMEAWRLGIDQPLEFSFADMWPPFWEGRGISASDFDRDGDIDVVTASTEHGLYFYANDGSGRFTAVDFPLGELRELPVFNAAFVDVDNDLWPDLFITTYRAGNYVMKNVGGRFDAANLQEVKNRDDAILTLAASFGDVDKDGDLDLALGNWASGWYRRIPGEESRNRIVFNEGGALTGEHFEELPGLPGETLTMLLTDIDADGNLDLLEGNDFEMPDMFYRVDGKGGFTPITRAEGIIPQTTTTTMALKTADLHNDGVPEIYAAQIAGRSSGVHHLKVREIGAYCEGIERPADLATCRTNMAIKRWYKSGHSFDPSFASRCLTLEGRYRDECKAMLVKDLAIQSRDASMCDLIPVNQPRGKQLCDIHFQPIREPSQAEMDETIPQILRRNVLLERTDDGTYRERAKEEGLEVGGWSWDTKVIDADNDGWQDVYIVNGTWVPNEITPSNLFYRNMGNGTFKESSGPFGLEDYLMTAASAAFDMDNDGDIDFLTMTVNGPVMAFVNNASEGNAIVFAFEDKVGNSFGIGGKIEIRYGGADARMQTRELQLGGGFMSFDAPVAHFGLGEYETVDSVAIRWADGGTTAIDTPLSAGALYRIARQPAATR
jgi:uncharacterized membrane protein YraQ (UPF0718 family)